MPVQWIMSLIVAVKWLVILSIWYVLIYLFIPYISFFVFYIWKFFSYLYFPFYFFSEFISAPVWVNIFFAILPFSIIWFVLWKFGKWIFTNRNV